MDRDYQDNPQSEIKLKHSNDYSTDHLIQDDSHLVRDTQIPGHASSHLQITKSEYIHHMFNTMGFTKLHFFMLLSIFLIKTVEGTEVLALSLASKMIEKDFGLAENSSSVINLIILMGNFIGCLISILIDHRLPRKHLVYIGVLVTVIFGFASIFAQDIVTFVVLRNLVNVGIGIMMASTTAIVTESVNLNYRGFILNIILISSNVGEVFIQSSMNSFVVSDHGWRKIFLVAIAPVIFLINLGHTR